MREGDGGHYQYRLAIRIVNRQVIYVVSGTASDHFARIRLESAEGWGNPAFASHA